MKPKKENTVINGLFNYVKPNHTNYYKRISLVVAKISLDYKELDEQIMSMMERREGIWTCIMCCRTQSKLNIQQHVEGVHMKDGTHPCNQCGNILKSRKALRNQMEIHKTLFSFE